MVHTRSIISKPLQDSPPVKDDAKGRQAVDKSIRQAEEVRRKSQTHSPDRSTKPRRKHFLPPLVHWNQLKSNGTQPITRKAQSGPKAMVTQDSSVDIRASFVHGKLALLESRPRMPW